jgi:hypothetical protein
MNEPADVSGPVVSESSRWRDRALWLAVNIAIVVLLLLCVALVMAATR